MGITCPIGPIMAGALKDPAEGTWALVADMAWAMAAWEWAVDMATWRIWSGPRGAQVSVSTRRGTPTTIDRTALVDPATASQCA